MQYDANMMPDLSWLGLQNDELPKTNKTDMLASQQRSTSKLPEETQNDLLPNILALQKSESNDKMDKHLQEWQDMKPDIARLVALEGEVIVDSAGKKHECSNCKHQLFPG
ncbi:hypothetical protein [Paraglaciecola sp. MB-3u-78]|jgi:hypothetical protein|uniref:hypothetical protein n=1 Tax=Paraglaciecola sp. MB-3u-78 TaxID=2058332 RepID=UPI000C326C30|nr:hypothetical protein [Paraglaciecola sp. MB-3u-78]PKH00408.1 hypothetical protein CXF95_02360 [Paraglaciecola sp. MB-3u-78]